jgi:hypothetical protein
VHSELKICKRMHEEILCILVGTAPLQTCYMSTDKCQRLLHLQGCNAQTIIANGVINDPSDNFEHMSC